MCLKTENCCLKTFVEIRVGEKMYENEMKCSPKTQDLNPILQKFRL